jgi:hypothetical protein
MAARNCINRVAGSKRALGHGQLYMGVGNLDFMRYQVEELKPDVWKGYNIATAAKVDLDPNSDMRRWRLDDEAVAYPTYSLIDSYATKEKMKQYPGFRTLCCTRASPPRAASPSCHPWTSEGGDRTGRNSTSPSITASGRAGGECTSMTSGRAAGTGGRADTGTGCTRG